MTYTFHIKETWVILLYHSFVFMGIDAPIFFHALEKKKQVWHCSSSKFSAIICFLGICLWDCNLCFTMELQQVDTFLCEIKSLLFRQWIWCTTNHYFKCKIYLFELLSILQIIIKMLVSFYRCIKLHRNPSGPYGFSMSLPPMTLVLLLFDASHYLKQSGKEALWCCINRGKIGCGRIKGSVY